MILTRATLAVPMLLLATHAATSRAQTPIRPLHLTEDHRVVTSLPGGSLPAAIIGADNRMVVAPRAGWGDISAYDSAGKPLSWKLSIGNSDKSDIRYISGIGAFGTSVWINDPGYKQIALIDDRGEVSKSIEYPTWIHPTWGDRHAYPVFGTFQPLALYPDSSMLVVPERPHAFLSTPGFDKSAEYLVRATTQGTILRTIARVPDPTRGQEPTLAQRAQFVFPRPMWGVSTDGARIAVVLPASSPQDTVAFRVTVLTDRGDTVFSRSYPYATVRAAALSLDSLLHPAPPVTPAAAAAKRPPPTHAAPPYSPSSATHVGLDYTTWIRIPGALRGTVRLVLDPKGDILGMVGTPEESVMLEADGDHMWLSERSVPTLPRSVVAIVRYRVEPGAPPPIAAAKRAPPARSP